jgi:hypothetical protein
VTPGWSAESNGSLRLVWGSPDDFLAYLNSTVAPAASQYGFDLIIEPKPKGDVLVDRA